MKKLCGVVLATLLLLAFSSNAWARNWHEKYNNKEDKYHYYQRIRQRIHQMRIKYQFRALKHRYNKSHPDAQGLFLDYLGITQPSIDEQIQALKEEYEQKITERDNTIAALQQQLEELTTQLSAECDTRLSQAQEQWQTDTQQQLNEMAAAHQTALADLTVQLEVACDDRLEQAYAEWQASAEDQCQGSGVPEQVSALNTGSVNPYAIDTDGSGNMFVLDRDNLSVTEFDTAGAQRQQWNPGTFGLPSDIALDSQRNVYVLDRQAAAPLQKFSANGTPIPFGTGSLPIVFPSGIFIDSSDTLYVTDYGGAQGGRVLVFDSAGNLLRTFGEVDDLALDEYNDIMVDEANQVIHVVTSSRAAKFDLSGGYLGAWEGDFGRPFGITSSSSGDIYVADTYNDEIDQYDSEGNLKLSFAQDAYRPFRIHTDAADKLYIADYGNRLIRIFE